ncbi:MAG: B12-binding domain-containing radical SAM protein, partial [Nitrospinota bacterium]
FVALQDNAPPLVDADDPRLTLFLSNQRLTDQPFPARHLVEVDSYRYYVDGVRALSLIAQLGCPFNCGFCGGRESPAFRRVRMRSTENVVAEIVHLHRTYGVSGFMLYDDELNVNPNMVELMEAIVSAQEALGGEFRLRGFIKAQLFTDKQAEAMYRAGFRWILVGFESGSPRILKNINKRSTREENTRCMEIAKRHGLKVKALMSIGHPGESEQTVSDTHDWLLEVQPDDFDVTIITTYPGSPYYDHAIPHPTEKGVWVYTYNNDKLYSRELDYIEVSDYYKGDPDGGYTSFVHTDYLVPDALVGLRDFVERSVRKTLGIPFSPSAPAIQYEHSMGQSDGRLPSNILRTTGPQASLRLS